MLELRVLTFNVFFGPVAQATRYREILRLASLTQAQVLLFQEVTSPFIHELQQTEWVRRDFDCSDVGFTGSTIQPYGVCTLARKELHPAFSFHPMDSNMGRRLLLCALTVHPPAAPPCRVIVGNVHLESLANHPTRVRQLRTCHTVLSHTAQAAACSLQILAGDFNFCSYSNFDGSQPLENDCLTTCLPGWTDVWPLLKDTAVDKGYTFDTDTNGFTEGLVAGPERMRYDRVMARCAAGWAAADVRLLGTEQLPQQGVVVSPSASQPAAAPVGAGTDAGVGPKLRIDVNCPAACIFPSDHYGLLATFSHA